MKEFTMALYIPKTLAQKKGITETFSNQLLIVLDRTRGSSRSKTPPCAAG